MTIVCASRMNRNFHAAHRLTLRPEARLGPAKLPVSSPSISRDSRQWAGLQGSAL